MGVPILFQYYCGKEQCILKRFSFLGGSLPEDTTVSVVQASPTKRLKWALLLLYPDGGNKKGFARAVGGRYLVCD